LPIGIDEQIIRAMSSGTGAPGGKLSQRAFAPALILLGLAIVINYVDRGNLSIAAPVIKNELQLSATQLGILFSAFFYTYTALQFVIGGVVDRLGANRVLSVGLLIWSLATIAMGFAGGFAAMLLLRLLLGVGESVAFPCTSKVIAENVPPENRGLANGVITAGLKLGPAIGAFGAGMLIAKYGWRPVFWGMGILSLLWLPAWRKWRPHSEEVRNAGSSTIAYVQILRQRSFWGCAAGHFSFNYLSYFFLTWLPFYLSHERHLSQHQLARAAGAYYLIDSASALLTGWLCDRWIQRGAQASFVRKAASVGGSLIAAVAMIACAFAATDSYYPWLLLAGVGSGAAGCGVFLFSQTLAGPRAVGQWSALQNGFGNFAGLTGPALTGFLVDRSGHFFSAFALAAAVAVAGALVWAFGVRFAPVNWREDDADATGE
jgi:MFS transporter, ACS family, D-galactonate transporter